MNKLQLGTRIKAGATVEPAELRNQECVIVANRDEEYVVIPDAALSRIFYRLAPMDLEVLAVHRQRRPDTAPTPPVRPGNLDY